MEMENLKKLSTPPSPECNYQKKSFKEIIKILHDLFIEPANPNAPRYRNLLTNNLYTLKFLSTKIGISEQDVYDLFTGLSQEGEAKKDVYRIYKDEKKNIFVLNILNRDEFKKYIQNIYKKIFNKKAEHKVSKSRSQIKESHPDVLPSTPESAPKLSDLERKYLQLILEYNPNGEFNVLWPRINPKNFKHQPKLRFSKAQRLGLINKCMELGIIKKIGENRYKFINFNFAPYY